MGSVDYAIILGNLVSEIKLTIKRLSEEARNIVPLLRGDRPPNKPVRPSGEISELFSIMKDESGAKSVVAITVGSEFDNCWYTSGSGFLGIKSISKSRIGEDVFYTANDAWAAIYERQIELAAKAIKEASVALERAEDVKFIISQGSYVKATSDGFDIVSNPEFERRGHLQQMKNEKFVKDAVTADVRQVY